MLERSIGTIDIVARGTLALFQRMLLNAGVQIPEPVLDLSDEAVPGAPVPIAGDTRPFGLVIAEPDDSFIVLDQGLTHDVFTPGQSLEIDSVEELLCHDGVVVPGRVLDGDERLRILPIDPGGGSARPTAARVTSLPAASPPPWLSAVGNAQGVG